MSDDVPRATPSYCLDYRPVMCASELRVVAAKLLFGRSPRSAPDGKSESSMAVGIQVDQRRHGHLSVETLEIAREHPALQLDLAILASPYHQCEVSLPFKHPNCLAEP